MLTANMFTHYHDSANWSMLHETLKKMGREDLIGNSKKHLAPAFQLAIMGGAIRQSDGSTFKSKQPALDNKYGAKKYGGLPKSFNNMKNAARPARNK